MFAFATMVGWTEKVLGVSFQYKIQAAEVLVFLHVERVVTVSDLGCPGGAGVVGVG